MKNWNFFLSRSRRKMNGKSVLLVLLLGVYWFAFGATITVTNSNDSGAGSLRQAIADASAGDVIEFSITGTITLASTLTINKNLTINGPGASSLTLSGNNSIRVIYVSGSPAVVINSITIANGSSATYGGGIENEGNLTIQNCIITNCSANDAGNGFGGGIDNYGGTLLVDNSIFTSNTAGSRGGAIACDNGGNVTITNSSFDGNSSYLGGALGQNQTALTSTLTVRSSTISNNSAVTGSNPAGGAIYWDNGTIELENVTISGNESKEGGAIADASKALTVDINACTIVNNEASVEGGAFWLKSTTINIKNTILAANTAPSDAIFHNDGSGGINSQGYNLCDDALAAFASTGDVQNATLNIGVLADNGGVTQTHALLAGSDALDAIPQGGNAYNGVPATDQIGTARPQGGNADIGAYEKAVIGAAVWNGSLSTVWTVAGNWDNANVPDGTTDVTIPSGCGRYPEINGNDSCQDIIIENGGSLTIQGGGSLSASGDLTIEDNSSFQNSGTLIFVGGDCHLNDLRASKLTLGNVQVGTN